MPEEIDTTNKFVVAANGEECLIMNPPRGAISRTDALLLAAYLVTMFDQDSEFERVRDAVAST